MGFCFYLAWRGLQISDLKNEHHRIRFSLPLHLVTLIINIRLTSRCAEKEIEALLVLNFVKGKCML